MEVVVRPFRPDDIGFTSAQTAQVGWDTTAELFSVCLAHDPDGCFIAEADGRSVGLVTTTRYQRQAWIGNLIVVPECRRRGLGQRLMHGLRCCGFGNGI